jgi:hypothetical protein
MRIVPLGLALTIGAAAIIVAYNRPALAQGEPIKFGAVVSVTGVGAGLGVNERNGLLLAEKTINSKGGFKGRPIRIIVEDDTSNPDTAVLGGHAGNVEAVIVEGRPVKWGGSMIGCDPRRAIDLLTRSREYLNTKAAEHDRATSR